MNIVPLKIRAPKLTCTVEAGPVGSPLEEAGDRAGEISMVRYQERAGDGEGRVGKELPATADRMRQNHSVPWPWEMATFTDHRACSIFT